MVYRIAERVVHGCSLPTCIYSTTAQELPAPVNARAAAQDVPNSGARASKRFKTTDNRAPEVLDRIGVYRANAESELEAWRFREWSTHYSHTVLRPEAILPDLVLTCLAIYRKIQTVDDLQRELSTPWHHASKY